MKDAAAAAASLAILHTQDGAPLLPEGVSASISHKRHMAVALVQSGSEGRLGKQLVYTAGLILSAEDAGLASPWLHQYPGSAIKGGSLCRVVWPRL